MSGSLTKIHPYPKNLPVDTRISIHISIHTQILSGFIIHGYPYPTRNPFIFFKSNKFFFFFYGVGKATKFQNLNYQKKKIKVKEKIQDKKKKKKIHTIFHLKKKSIYFKF